MREGELGNERSTDGNRPSASARRGVHLNGIDTISWDATGRIVRFKAMLRPIKALHTVMAVMAKQLQRGGSAPLT